MIGWLYLFLILFPIAAIFAAFAGHKVTYVVLGSLSFLAWYFVLAPH